MVRTQLYLTDGQNERLKRLVDSSGCSQSDLSREAIDRMLAAVEGADWKERLRCPRGMWQGATTPTRQWPKPDAAWIAPWPRHERAIRFF